MREGELPEGVGEAPQPAVSPEAHRRRFAELAGWFEPGEFDRVNEDGSITKIVSYDRYVDPLDRGHMAIVKEFRLRAAALGYRDALSTLVVPTQSNFDPRQSEAVRSADHPHRALTFVQFVWEKPPAAKPGGTTARRP